MTVQGAADLEPLHLAFLAPGEQAGLPLSRDLSGAQRTGVGLAQSGMRDGARWTVVDGYLRPGEGRPGLQVRTGVWVDRVVVEGGRAVGVDCGGTVVRAGEVVLAAGAMRFPQLLTPSGIGPADHLRQHSTGVLQELPGTAVTCRTTPPCGRSGR